MLLPINYITYILIYIAFAVICTIVYKYLPSRQILFKPGNFYIVILSLMIGLLLGIIIIPVIVFMSLEVAYELTKRKEDDKTP